VGFVVETIVKFLSAFLILAAGCVFGANPSFQSFSPTYFTTNNYVIQINPDVVLPPTAFLPNLDFEIFEYEHFGCGRNAGGQIGRHGWIQSNSGGAGIFFNTHANHWGTVELWTTSLVASTQTMLQSEAINRPVIPPVNAVVGWTNRVIWRLNGTNSCRAWVVITGGVGGFGLGAGTGLHNIGIFINTTNSDQILGYCNTTSLALNTSTNLGTLQSGQWYTNEWWSHISGVVCFTLNDGAVACISNNITSLPCQQAAAVAKTVGSTDTNILEIDEWFLVKAREL